MIHRNNIKIYHENLNRNNTNGSFFIREYGFFYKINSIEEYWKELSGYKIMAQYYNVPKLIYNKANQNTGILLYEYNEKINTNTGLLIDYFAQKDVLDNVYIKILNKYKEVFKNSIEYKKTNNVDVFFRDRVKSRINKYYNDEFFRSIEKNKLVNFNGIEVELNIKEIIEEIKEFYKKNDDTYTVVSQCDPNDCNICEDGMILDFLCGGFNPLMAEFATFVWYNIGQGEYLSLKYNKKSFEKHDKIYKKMNKVIQCHDNSFIYSVRKIRKEAINKYIEIVIKPLVDNIKFDNWYIEFKNYLAMKILAVFNVSDMCYKDKIMSCSYLSLFYNNNLKDIEELKTFINKII